MSVSAGGWHFKVPKFIGQVCFNHTENIQRITSIKKNILEDISSFYEATDTCVLDFR